MKRIADLTCCRAIFAAWVFGYHVNLQTDFAPALGPFQRVITTGFMGVDGFFVLSGMILAHVHPTLSPAFGEARLFWAKRFVRIYPVHLLMIVGFAALIGAAGVMHIPLRDPERFSVRELLSHLALVQAWGVSDKFAWNYPAWTISAEWAGYLVFPLLWPILRPLRGWTLASVLIAAAIMAAAVHVIGGSYGLTLAYDGALYRFFPEFVAGIVIVPLLHHLRPKTSGYLAVAAGCALTIGGAASGAEVVALPGLWLLVAGFMAAAQQGRRPLLARIPGVEWLGEISYSYYMSFALVETVLAAAWRYLGADPAGHKLVYAAMMTGLTLACATLAHYLVEEPALTTFSRLRGAKLGVVSAPTGRGAA